jgi:hypothetical protein
MLGQIRWGWVLVGGLVAEVALLMFVPIQFLPGGETLLLWIVVPICLIVPALTGCWIARKAAVAHLLHGGLVGLVALLIYVALTWTQELPAAYTVANYLKIVGGLSGGWYASRAASTAGASGADPAV